MRNNNLTFFVHNHNLAPSYSVPALDVYQSQKNIQVVSNSDPLAFASDNSNSPAVQSESNISASFLYMRLEAALGPPGTIRANYFPGAIIPGPGGASCSELDRGALLFDQFKYLLAFDSEMLLRTSKYQDVAKNGAESQSIKYAPALSRLFCLEQSSQEEWLWQYVDQPSLYFLHQAPIPDCDSKISQEKAIAIFGGAAARLFDIAVTQAFSQASVTNLLSLISDAWFCPSSGVAPVTWGSAAINKVTDVLRHYQGAVTGQNMLPFLFELEAMASHLSLTEEKDDRQSFARGVFAGNYIEVAMSAITSIKPTEFCVRERLFDEVINLSSRGFAPVVINEYGMVADGNHRLASAYLWNVLKYCQDLEWCIENDVFQKRVASFAGAVEKGLLRRQSQLSPIILHQVLSHLAHFLCRPDWRARLNSYTRPLLMRHDFISDLPVVMLPEYLSGAVVKSLYDDGQKTERACPSMYEAMSLNHRLVLPPRASYHFTDAALLPWFTVLKTSCGSRRRNHTRGPRGLVVPIT